MKKYLIFVIGDIEPEVGGPYKNERVRTQAAREHRENDSEREDGIFWADVSGDELKVGSYSGGYLEPSDEDLDIELINATKDKNLGTLVGQLKTPKGEKEFQRRLQLYMRRNNGISGHR